MKKLAAATACLAVLCAAAVRAEKKRASPHEQVAATLAGNKVTVTYGRPFKKGREIFGALVPWKQVWRLGADEATTLEAEADLLIGSVRVKKGIYTLYAIPAEKEWTLVINKKVKTWGAFDYDQKLDVGRTAMTVTAADKPVEQLTISFDAPGEKGTLRIAWDKTVATVAVGVAR